MAEHKPLVLVAGRRKQLPVGDTLPLTALAPVVAAAISDGDTTHAPSGDAVFAALMAKGDLAGTQSWGGTNTFNGIIKHTTLYQFYSADESIFYGGFGPVGSGTFAIFGNANTIALRPGGRTAATGCSLTTTLFKPEVDNAVDLGAASARWKSFFAESVNTNVLSGSGAGAEVSIINPTSDGADNGRFRMYPAGALTGSRSAYLYLAGNEHPSVPGEARINSGDTGNLRLGAGGSNNVVLQSSTIPSADNTLNFGSASNRWKEIFAANATINTSDAREKALLRDHSAAELAAALDLARLRSIWKWIAAITDKGEDLARWHCSPTVQDVIAVMEAHSLDPFTYSFICYDQWPERIEPAEYEAVEAAPAATIAHPAIYERTQVYTEDGQPERFAERLVSPAWTEVITPAVTEQRLVRAEVIHPAADRYSLRPTEFEAFCRRGMAQLVLTLEARVVALESMNP